jgi:hypothetical protein
MPSLGTTLLAHSRPEESRRSREWHRRESRVIDTPGRRRGGGRRATLRDSVGTRGLEEETIITRAIQHSYREKRRKSDSSSSSERATRTPLDEIGRSRRPPIMKVMLEVM